MKGSHTLVLLIFVISACCSIDKRDFEFNETELGHFSDYKDGDTIYFQSNLGDMDTITIAGFDSERYEKCGGFLSRRPLNGRWVIIKHLPVDKWHGTSQDMTVIKTVYWTDKFGLTAYESKDGETWTRKN